MNACWTNKSIKKMCTFPAKVKWEKRWGKSKLFIVTENQVYSALHFEEEGDPEHQSPQYKLKLLEE